MKKQTKSSNISIIIENNLFSKNKEGKKEDVDTNKKPEQTTRQSSLQYVAPFTPEPSFMSEIRQAFSDKNMYGMRYNTQPPPQMYNPQGQPNHVFGNNNSASQQEEVDEQDIEGLQILEEQQPQEGEIQQAVQPEVIFSIEGKYLGNKNNPVERNRREKRYKVLLNNINNGNGKNPHRKTIIQYSLQQYYPDMFPDFEA